MRFACHLWMAVEFYYVRVHHSNERAPVLSPFAKLKLKHTHTVSDCAVCNDSASNGFTQSE